ncbi:MAG: MBOAT family protein [Verrucomicrobiae bacterium]|nr:MBOAT family protein [Verrucomicrobiae bacterium]
MLFTSYSFLFLFLPFFFICYLGTPRQWRVYLLLFGSYLFYGFWRFDYCLLLFTVTLLGYLGGLWIHSGGGRRRTALITSVTLLISLLGWFKYAGFFGESWNGLASWFGMPGLQIQAPEVLLPIGISFFTFQTLSYVVDVYRGREYCRSFFDFAAYVALFPQLVAGPIVRYGDVSGEIHKPVVSFDDLREGISRFMLGFCKKVWIANNVAPVADWAFAQSDPAMSVAWLGLVCYTLQIYFDFSGYSDMAIGIGMMLGFRFPENFRNPYRSTSITEFWQRWHMTMSSFFRDYLYIPLGGNRGGRLRTLCNLVLTMLLAGLWHGAGWTFVAWGGLHGLLLVIHRLWQKSRHVSVQNPGLLIRSGATLLTLLSVMAGWVLFRSDTLEASWNMYRGLAGLNGFNGLSLFFARVDAVFLIVLTIGILAVVFEGRMIRWIPSTSIRRLLLLAAFVSAVHEIGGQGYNPFLYFQF